MNKNIVRASVVGVSFLIVYLLFFEYSPVVLAEFEEDIPSDTTLYEIEPIAPTILYGLVVDSFQVAEHAVQRNQSISDILLAYNVSHQTIFQLANLSKSVFDVRKIAPNKKYTVIYQDADSLPSAAALVYEPNPEEYVVFNLRDSIKVYKEQRPISIVERSITGTIQPGSSLSEEVNLRGGTPELVNLVADMYGWQIDFDMIYPGDQFKVIYTERTIDGIAVGVEEIIGAEFIHRNNKFLSVAFDQGDGIDYFDEDAESLRKAFLRYPVKFTRISSRYTAKRFHPVQKRYKAHLGIDFAARTGTEIYAAGDGVIVKAVYEKYNGYNVKIKHNGTYSTQYLHMSSFASGIKAGVKVKQGQFIGRVGSTGLASGPHLCYRFWKNGRQVDAMKVDLPASDPIVEDQMTTYGRYRDYIIKRLEDIEYPKEETEILVAQIQ